MEKERHRQLVALMCKHFAARAGGEQQQHLVGDLCCKQAKCKKPLVPKSLLFPPKSPREGAVITLTTAGGKTTRNAIFLAEMRSSISLLFPAYCLISWQLAVHFLQMLVPHSMQDSWLNGHGEPNAGVPWDVLVGCTMMFLFRQS